MENENLKNEGGQRVDNDSLVHGQEGGLRTSVHGQSMDKDELVYGQGNYLSMDKAAEYASLSEKTLRRKIREVLVSQGLNWKSSPKQIEEKSRKIKKVNVKKTILGFSSFDWEVSDVWLDELEEKIVHRQRVDNDSLVHGQEGGLRTSVHGQSMDNKTEEDKPIDANFMTSDASAGARVKNLEMMEIDGRRYTKEHLQDIIENYKEEKETKKTMMELQRQINVVMAQMGQIQKMMLLKSPKEDNEEQN